MLLLLLVVPGTAGAATFVYLSSAGPDEPVLSGRRLRLTPTTANPHPPSGSGLVVSMAGIRMYLVPPAGQQFAPGSYSGVTDCGFGVAPGICVQSDGLFRSPVGGHLDVLDAAYDGSGTMIRLAAEFSQVFDVGGSELVGSLRFNAGDQACAAVPDGEPCDDADACSTESRCTAGHCMPVASVDCDAGSSGPCRDAAVCDPVGGACLPATLWPDFNSCETGNACVLFGSCRAGECVEGPPLSSCGDSNACTYDDCDTTSGCTHPPIAGTCGDAGLPSVSLFARRAPAVAAGDVHRSTPADGLTVSVRDDGGVYAYAPIPTSWWSVLLAPPVGQVLAPGVYEHAESPYASPRDPARPALQVDEARYGQCRALPGRFVVHEYSPGYREDGRGQALVLSADFEQPCEDGSRLTGSIRYRVGDASCLDAPDGTPCDDHDACTGGSTCEAGACRGRDAVVCGTEPGGCHPPSICDPATGACVAPAPFLDGTACADPASCVTAGTCAAGACVAAAPPCDDGNPCTADRCAGDGTCAHDTLPNCWLVSLHVKLRAQASGTLQGQSVQCGPLRCQRAGRQILLLPGDGTYRVPTGSIACTDGTTQRIPDEIGTVQAMRDGRLRLAATNAAEARRAFRQCLGRRVALKQRQWIRLSPDGTELTGVIRTRFTIFDRLPLVETSVADLTGRLGTFPPETVLDPRPRQCPEQLVLGCRAN